MIRRKRVGLIISLILAASCVFASAATVVAAETHDYKAEMSAAYEQYKVAVAGSGIMGENSVDQYKDYYDNALSVADLEESVAAERLSVIIGVGELAEKRNEQKALLEAKFNGEIETSSLSDAEKLANEFLDTFVLDAADLQNATAFNDKKVALNNSLTTYEAAIQTIKDEDVAEFETARTQMAEAIGEKFDELTISGVESVGNQVVGSYSTAQYSELKKVFETYVTRTETDGVTTDQPKEDGELDKVIYVAAEVAQKREDLEEIRDKAIAELEAIPRNVLESTYALYNDFVACKDDLRKLNSELDGLGYSDAAAKRIEIAAKESVLSALAEAVKNAAPSAISFYNNGSAEVQARYSKEVKALNDFMLDPPVVTVTQYQSSLKDKYNAVKVTAYYVQEDGGTLKEAKVFPSVEDGGVLEVFANANGAAKRTANNLVKEENKNLSVAYLLNISVRNGYRAFEVPTSIFRLDAEGNKVTDAYGNPVMDDVCYRIEIDLNKYYENYCKATGYEQDKLDNVKNAYEAVKGGEGALCYGYGDGAIEKALAAGNKQTKLEEGTLVFYTTGLNNLCIAGTGLENWLTNPWTYVILIVALILLIVIIKLIVKHWKYTIKFIVNGGSRVRSIRVSKGEAIVLPESPVKTGLVFGGWFVDSACTVRFLETKLNRRRGYKLYAKWSAPVSAEVLTSFYDGLRTRMSSYEKRSFKPTLGMVEKDLIANMFGRENYIILYLALDPAKAADLVDVPAQYSHKDKKFASLPTKIIISDPQTYADALKLTEYTMLSKGLQLMEEDRLPELIASTVEERTNGFAYFVRNERVAATTADYFELLRITVKSYVMETDNGMFKPGDRFTFARIYYDAKSVDLYLPSIKGIKELEKGSRKPRFGDTPVHIVICDNSDMEKAFDLIEKAMLYYGFTKHPENSNDLEDVVLSDTNGFAYSVRF